ncbi:tRNA (guanine-N(7)-)-methyltransferase non-catalytic subunit wdr4-like [Gigantopelta aegis]|uniref:tRNA (guanine-N(7)-)-methyltransferase non-catalytic subunit wdr4-like n=1 Tax=Gigantopelta aegis TaxID=1735272 RepID=UPI001B8890AD|nr:tRNA (guanine-N(7)-)-methyltransferase non-catalytic subunit wdr4-like [Gigantopelta aegis]
MAAIRRKCDNIVFISGNTLAVLDFRTRVLQFLQVPTIEEQNPQDEEEEGKKDKEESLNTATDNTILASAFSPSGLYFAVCDNQKQLHLFATEPEWTLTDTRSLSRRCTSIVFTKDDTTVIVGDKCGDVYSIKVSDWEKPAQLCLGHLSILLDVVLVHNDQYIVTCDRDEKIRISHFPNAYNIHSFCLGHTEFVSSLVYAKDDDLLISGSGDCSVRVWCLDGKERCCIKSHICSQSPAEGQPSDLEENTQSSDLQRNTQSTDLEGNTQSSDLQGNAQSSDLQGNVQSSDLEGNVQSSDLQGNAGLTEQPAIEKIVYNNKHKLLAVSVSRQARVEMYQLQVSDSSVSLTLLQTLTFNTDPWDIVFDDHDLLWVLLPVEDALLKVFELKEDKENHCITVSEVCDNSAVEACKQTMNKHWTFFKVSLEKPSVLPSLWKQRIDNVSDYLLRKQQRLKGDANGEELCKVKTLIPEKKLKAS